MQTTRQSAGEPRREIVEIPAVAREAVHADHDVRVVRAPPLGVRHAVETVRTEAGEVPEAGMGHREDAPPGVRGATGDCGRAA